MSLRDIANEITASSFDPKTDAVATAAGLPAGDYTTVVSEISHRVFDSGWDAFNVTFEVVEGEHAGQKENVNISFAEKAKSGKAIPQFILERNMKLVMKLGAFLGVEITPDDFADNETDTHENLYQKLRGHEGVAMILKVTVRENKKDPSNPYTSYDLDEAEQPEELPADDPFASDTASQDATEPPVVDDSELPFD
ncbi:hypothetical protein [uncultured Secundilactobacillus sp.]|uniref:hypothetical protein n=1 Tax=uncultured Secundilactobacillus sp. TaxID=2813935 RepID=UPI002583DE52|nr:hypothetical protein [uncultured Secundilactobacillus sp.]